MRPIATQRNELRYPLDILLGTKAQIRVLRLLAESERPMSPSEIQEHTGVSLPGTLKVLDRLAKTGFLDVVGSERSRLYAFHPSDVLSASLQRLFEAERDWHDALVVALRDAFANLTHPVDSAWVALDGYTLGDPIEIGFLTGAKLLAQTKSEIRDLVAGIEKDFRITTVLSGFTRADLVYLERTRVVLLAGYSPFERSASSFSATSHVDLETRSLERARRLVKMIRRDPTIVSRALRHVNHIIDSEPESHRTDLREWQQILETYSQRQLLNLLVDTGERATQLRQSAPFFAVLTPDEKSQLRGSGDSDDA